jgi:predicted nucleic acid-binding protein
MMGEDETRPSISVSDFNMRIFIDTNVLIDFVEDRDEKNAKSFIELFKNSVFSNIELVTSDYILWEFNSHFREDLYIKKLINDYQFWHLSASKECRKSTFKKVTIPDMETFDDNIKQYVNKFAKNPVSIERLIGKELNGFNELMDKILRSSKFSYQDSIVFVSAIYTNSHIIMTLDETFSSESHLRELREAVRSIPHLKLIEFKKPKDFSSESHLKKEYKTWFIKQNKNKQIGSVYKYFPGKKVICVNCLNNYTLRAKDYIYLVNFDIKTHDKFYKSFQIESAGLRDFKTNCIIKEGNNVTIRLPEDFFLNGQALKNAMVFVSE